jgi:uncharacterized protein YggU (UPF0235/DUF167 family)
MELLGSEVNPASDSDPTGRLFGPGCDWRLPLPCAAGPVIVLIRCLASRVASHSMTDSIIVKVRPGSRKGPLVEIGSNGELTIYVREPAVDGKANDAVARLLAAHLQLPRSRVELVSGATSRQKRFRVSR